MTKEVAVVCEGAMEAGADEVPESQIVIGEPYDL